MTDKKIKLKIYFVAGLGIKVADYLNEQEAIACTSSFIDYVLVDSHTADVARLPNLPSITSTTGIKGLGGQDELANERFEALRERLSKDMDGSDIAVLIGGIAKGGTGRNFIPKMASIAKEKNIPCLIFTSSLRTGENSPANKLDFLDKIQLLSNNHLLHVIDTHKITTKHGNLRADITPRIIGKQIWQTLSVIIKMIFNLGIDLEDLRTRCFAHPGHFHCEIVRAESVSELMTKSLSREYELIQMHDCVNWTGYLAGPIITNQDERILHSLLTLSNPNIEPRPKLESLQDQEHFELGLFCAGLNQKHSIHENYDDSLDLSSFDKIEKVILPVSEEITKDMFLEENNEKIKKMSGDLKLSYRKIAKQLTKECKQSGFQFAITKDNVGEIVNS